MPWIKNGPKVHECRQPRFILKRRGAIWQCKCGKSWRFDGFGAVSGAAKWEEVND